MATDVAVDRDAEKLGDNAHSCMDRLSRNMAINEISSKVHMMQTSLSFLHTEVNNDREFLHLRLEELEHRLAAMERWKPVALPAAAAVDSKPRDPCDIDVDEDLDVLEYSLGSTLWDAPAFMGLPELGGGSASVIFFLAAVMNVVVQLFLTYQLLWSGAFITPDLFKDELSAARRWRLFEAHEYSRVDGSGVSLASRVCQGDQALSVASAQTSMLGQINSYLGLGQRDFEHSYLMSDGPILCLICITIFVVVIMKELRSLTMDVLAVLSVPRGRTRIEDGRLVALSMFRLLNMLFVDLGRLVVAVALLVTGTMWLAFTPDITDLILNAAALCFVMDLDEVLFEAAVPAVVQRYVANMAPLRYKRPRFHLEAILPLVLMAIVVTTSAVLFVMPNAEDMTNVKKALCRGQIDFSVHQNGAGYIVSSETTNFFEDIDMNGLKPLAVQELRDLPSMHGIVDPRWSLLALTREMYARERQMTVEDLAVQTYCADMDTFNDGVAIEESPVWFLTIRDAVPHERGRPMCRKAGGPQDCLPFTCPAAAYLCHNVSMMRTLCPVTCGCNDPTSSQIFGQPLGGCPLMCQTQVNQMVRQLPCTNKNVQGMAGWRGYWDNYHKVLAILVPQILQRYDYAAFIQRKLDMGCDDLTPDPFAQHMFCDERDPFLSVNGLSTIRGFCPETCCRLAYDSVKCPASCPPQPPP